MLPVAQRGDGGDRAACLVRERRQVLEIVVVVTDVPDQRHQMRSLAREPLDGGAGGAVDPVVQVDVGDAGDGEAVQLGRQAGNGHVVPRDLDGGWLDEKAIAQSGGAERAGAQREKSATG